MLTQAEADQFMQMLKHFVRPPATISIPPGADDTYELADSNDREKFLLDVWRGTLRLSKLKLQNRVRAAVVLVRLDVDGAPHTNPDGTRLAGTHIHLFKEGYDDKWAYPADSKKFTLLSDPGKTFHDFCAYCKIESPPPFQGVIA
ncbi:MAG: DUF6978 family protein [Terriglobia bacterium]